MYVHYRRRLLCRLRETVSPSIVMKTKFSSIIIIFCDPIYFICYISLYDIPLFIRKSV